MTPPNIGFFKDSLEAGHPSNFMDTYGVGKKTFDFTIYWAKEHSDVFISAAVEGTDGYYLDNIKVSCKPCTIEPSLSIVTPGQELVCSTLYKFENKGRIKPEWYFDNTFFQKNRQADSQTSTSIYLKALKAGITNIGVKVSMNNDDKRIEEDPVKGEMQIQIKQPYTLKPNKSSVCVGNFITYEIENLQGNERIVWEALRHTSLYSGQGTKSATFQVTEQGYIEIAATISQNNESIILTSNDIWAGKPTINTGLETSHVMTERNPVTIDASNEFFHYKGGISYAIESEDAEYVTVTETDKKFKVETTIPGNKRGEIKLRLKVSNDCGEVSNLHTIAYDTLPGVSADKPIQLRTQKDHGFYTTNNYELSKYVGELQKFQMFFAFKLERKTDIDFVSRVGNTIDYQPFKIYHKDNTELTNPLYTYTPSDNYMKISEMPIGEYLWVIDINRNNQSSLHISLNAFIKGGDPHVPYIVDKINGKIDFQDLRDTRLYDSDFKYTNENGQLVEGDKQHNYVYYLLRLEEPTILLLHSTYSHTGAELRIMTGQPFEWQIMKYISGIRSWEEIKENLFLGCICNKTVLHSGEYTLVFNGYKYSNGGVNNGLICMNILELEE